MWLSTGSSQAERSAIAAYFAGAETAGNTLESPLLQTDLEALLAVEIATRPALSSMREHIRLQETSTGLRIELTDANQNALFTKGSSTLSPTGEELLTNMGTIIATLPLDLTLEGHTDAFKTAPNAPTNWEISSARASTALAALEQAGIAPNRFKGITGLAATKPLLPNQPHAAVNRRISIVLEFSG